MRVIILFFLGGLLVLFLMLSCDISNPPDDQEFEGIPGPEFNIPDPLVSQGVKDRAAPDSESVFEPFRMGLYFARECVEIVKDIIEALNNYTIPDNGEFISGDGELIVITTDENREYATKIEVYAGTEPVAEDKYMQISYNKGINKGEAVFNVTPKQPDSEVNMVKIFYDGTGENPILKGWLTFNYIDTDPYVVYPVSVYFNGIKEDSIVTIDGGIGYHYFFDNDEIHGADNTYVDDHVYMFKAMADLVLEIAIVHLYFPQKNISLASIEDWEISESMLYILYTWLTLDGNAALKADLEVIYGDVIDSEEDLYALLDANRENPAVTDLIFILDLDNPIAYSAANGYESNGTAVPSEYTDIGDIGSVTFSEEPLDIFNIAIIF